MRRTALISICLLSVLVLSTGCGEKAREYEPGQEFTLPIGEEAEIKGEDLRLEFLEVTADSRCPKNVECIWAGEAKYKLRFTKGEILKQIEITEPGAEGQVSYAWHGYEIRTSLEPYPQDPGDIEAGDYKLRMSVSKLPEYELDTEFLLPIGEEVYFKDEDLHVKFTEVIEDSRCPRNVECIWAGQARYALELTQGEKSERAVLTEPGAEGGGQITVFDYEMRAALEPYPENPGDIEEKDYKLRVTIRKIAASSLELEDQADIYATVISQVYSKDHTFGSNPPDFPNLYLVYMTDDGAGGDFESPSIPHILPETLRLKIEERLSDLPTEIYWVSSFQEVPLEENSGIKGGGAVIRVGNIHEAEAGAVQVTGSIYIANLAGGGRTYILEKRDGTWRITGDTGVIWMS